MKKVGIFLGALKRLGFSAGCNSLREGVLFQSIQLSKVIAEERRLFSSQNRDVSSRGVHFDERAGARKSLHVGRLSLKMRQHVSGPERTWQLTGHVRWYRAPLRVQQAVRLNHHSPDATYG